MLRPTLLLLLIGLYAINLAAAVKVEKTEYRGWANCDRVSNGEIEVIVTSDVGPRIIRFGFVGGQNLFKEFPDQLGRSGEEKFHLRGGDRVWKAPEDPVATWAPDNAPVEVRVTPTGLIAREPIEPLTNLQKEIEISMAPSGTGVSVSHRITNRSLFALEFAPWALTMMAQGGTAITGFPPRGKHPISLEATNPLVMWAYTDLSDPRWNFTRKYMMLRQDPRNSEAQKLGLFNSDTWAAYLLNNEAFVKRSSADPNKTYPDFGCSFGIFTNNDFLEMETLGSLTKVLPGQTVMQVEHWDLFHNVMLSDWTDDAGSRPLSARQIRRERSVKIEAITQKHQPSTANQGTKHGTDWWICHLPKPSQSRDHHYRWRKWHRRRDCRSLRDAERAGSPFGLRTKRPSNLPRGSLRTERQCQSIITAM